MANRGGTLKTLEKLEKSVQAGNYYEAQQMYKTIYARYMAAKKYVEAMDLVQSGASVQLRHGQVTCGIELGILLVDALEIAKVQVSDSSLDRIRCIYKEFPRDDAHNIEAPEKIVATKARVEGCSAFLKAAIKWSSNCGGPVKGSPELHQMLADYIWSQSPKLELGKAAQHFVRGNCPDAFAAAITECMCQCPPGEEDLLITRGVLLYLSLGNLRDANKLFEQIKQLNESSRGDVLSSPLIQFVHFLLQTLQRDALPLFRMLRENYKTSIQRDSTLNELLDDIAERFYNVHRKNGLQGIFGDFMKMFANSEG